MITMDISGPERAPHRGDRLRSPGTLYYVLSAIAVERRDPIACRRYKLRVAKARDLDSKIRNMLLRSACRRDGSMLYEFAWHPRKKKHFTFEDYMRRVN